MSRDNSDQIATVAQGTGVAIRPQGSAVLHPQDRHGAPAKGLDNLTGQEASCAKLPQTLVFVRLAELLFTA